MATPPPGALSVTGKSAEIAYVGNMVRVLRVPPAEVEHSLMDKPFVESVRGTYLIDLGQAMRLLPPPPARILDLGAGSGWTSEMLARCGYEVVGVDIAPDMISLARRRLSPALNLRFEVIDYEEPYDLGEFDVVFIYDALHHAQREGDVIAGAYRSLRHGGILITMEPGVGHSEAQATRDAVAKFGTTEKDMSYAVQAPLMRQAGFSEVRQYVRVNTVTTFDLAGRDGELQQTENLAAVLALIRTGLTSVVVAVKGEPLPTPPADVRPKREPRFRDALVASARVFVRGALDSARMLRAALRREPPTPR